jgi:3-phenylpropionate/cinnamic acid dioxygenase small subunit
MADRPTLALEDNPKAVEEFVAGLQAAIDAWDADGFNRQFADDVLWGEPLWGGRQRLRQDPRDPRPNACRGERAASSRPG